MRVIRRIVILASLLVCSAAAQAKDRGRTGSLATVIEWAGQNGTKDYINPSISEALGFGRRNLLCRQILRSGGHTGDKRGFAVVHIVRPREIGDKIWAIIVALGERGNGYYWVTDGGAEIDTCIEVHGNTYSNVSIDNSSRSDIISSLFYSEVEWWRSAARARRSTVH